MARKTFFICLLLHTASYCAAQSSVHKIPDNVPKESLAVHINSTFFLTGESMVFTVYCFDPATGKTSDISRIAFIELVGEDSKPITQMKVPLVDGVGSGDFFFHGKTLPGNYTMIAYTKWMRNFPPTNFFRETISVINPQLPVPVSSERSNKTKEENLTGNSSSELTAKLDKSVYGLREKVVLEVGSSGAIVASINARVKEQEIRSSDFERVTGTANSKPVGYLPDLRSELITGVVSFKSNGKPMANTVVTLSAPSKRFQFLTSRTDTAGNFYFNTKNIDSEEIFLHVHNSSNEEYKLEVQNAFLESYPGMAPAKLSVDTTMQRVINRRYVSTQVENAFYSVKKDSTLMPGQFRRFFSANKVYDLDKFTRFPTMEDVFREIIPEVVIRARDGDFSFVMYNSESGYRFTNPPLILLDGIPIMNTSEVMRYDPNTVKTISLVTHHYYYGALETDGIISIETFEGTAKNISLSHLTKVKYIPPQPAKLFYSPDYATDSLKRIPDYRTQLYWMPTVKIDSKKKQSFTFFTGDVPGLYVVEIAGISSDGKKVWWKGEFEVR